MINNNSKETFQYTYSSKQQEEIREIRSRYMPREENKMERLRRLDAQVTRKATVYSLIAGVTGTLILGTGMSLIMVIGGWAFVPGVIIGLAGIFAQGLAYPLYNRTLKLERKRVAPEILRLTEELMK